MGVKWSLTLSDGHRLGLSENRVLRKIFGPKRDEVTGDWRQLHNFYSSSNVSRMIKSGMMRWARYVERMGAKRNRWETQIFDNVFLPDDGSH
jgi:hypothetical protein